MISVIVQDPEAMGLFSGKGPASGDDLVREAHIPTSSGPTYDKGDGIDHQRAAIRHATWPPYVVWELSWV